MSSNQSKLDPVTFEVLKNAFQGAVENMAEQVLRTCHSFVLYNRDFSSGLCDRNGELVSYGRIDLSGHIATMHHTCKAVIAEFGDDMKPGDVFILNDAYLGNTHWSDIRVVRPIFYDGEIIAYTQSSGHWADVGGNVPGSFDVTDYAFLRGFAYYANSNVGRRPLYARCGEDDRSKHTRAERFGR